MPRREKMSSADAAWLRMDRPTNRMVINSLLLFDQPVDWERVRAIVEERLVAPYPRFSQKVAQTGGPRGGIWWEDDEWFDIDRHLHRFALPAPGDRDALEALV